MSAENPYAPPETTSAGVPDAPGSFGWEVIGKAVWVEKFAQFPMVDPYSGVSDEVMAMNRLTLRYLPYWMTVIRWICVGVILLPLSDVIDREIRSSFVLAGFVGLVATIIGSTFFPITGLKVFFTTRTLRARAVQHWMVSSCFVVGILSGMKLEHSGLGPSRFPRDEISAVAFTVWILGLVWMYLLRRKLICRRYKDGHFEIRGFHPKALDLIAKEEGNSPFSPGLDSLSSSR